MSLCILILILIAELAIIAVLSHIACLLEEISDAVNVREIFSERRARNGRRAHV